MRAVEWLFEQLTSTWYDKESAEQLLEESKKKEDGYIWAAFTSGYDKAIDDMAIDDKSIDDMKEVEDDQN